MEKFQSENVFCLFCNSFSEYFFHLLYALETSMKNLLENTEALCQEFKASKFGFPYFYYPTSYSVHYVMNALRALIFCYKFALCLNNKINFLALKDNKIKS